MWQQIDCAFASASNPQTISAAWELQSMELTLEVTEKLLLKFEENAIKSETKIEQYWGQNNTDVCFPDQPVS